MKKLLTIVASMALAVGCMLPQPLHAEESTEATVKTKEQLQEAIKNVNINYSIRRKYQCRCRDTRK